MARELSVAVGYNEVQAVVRVLTPSVIYHETRACKTYLVEDGHRDDHEAASG